MLLATSTVVRSLKMTKRDKTALHIVWIRLRKKAPLYEGNLNFLFNIVFLAENACFKEQTKFVKDFKR